jgi:hypothetical protein
VANSSFTQDFNRYTYARNNPLAYTDPSGESLTAILACVIVGGMMNMMANASHIQTNGQAFAYFGIGALAAGVGAGVGIAASGFIGVGTGIGFIEGFGASAISGFIGGMSSSFIVGAGNTWLRGGTFGQGLFAGLNSGFKSGAISGLTAGIAGGIKGMHRKGVFYRGCAELGLNPSDPIPEELRNKIFVDQAKSEWFPDGPEAEQFVTHDNALFKDGAGRAIPGAKGVGSKTVFSGKASIYYHADRAFTSPLRLFTVMGHELIHVSQYAALAGQSYSLIDDPTFVDMLERYAYRYSNSIGEINYNYVTGRDYSTIPGVQNYDHLVDYKNFPWTSKPRFYFYPF